MKRYGAREVCNVVFRATAPMELGGKQFFKGEPVLYFESLKTTTLEGAGTTVYATGGRGNSRLMSWDGDKTLTFTMEDALITAESFAVLASATSAKITKPDGVPVHKQKRLGLAKDNADPNDKEAKIDLAEEVYTLLTEEPERWQDNYGNYFVKDAENPDEYKAVELASTFTKDKYYKKEENPSYQSIKLGKALISTEDKDSKIQDDLVYVLGADEGGFTTEPYLYTYADGVLTIADKDKYNASNVADATYAINAIDELAKCTAIYLDYYTTGANEFTRLSITPDSFGANFYVEADTLFRDDAGADYPAIFTIPNARVQSNFTITMASSGDPSGIMRLAA